MKNVGGAEHAGAQAACSAGQALEKNRSLHAEVLAGKGRSVCVRVCVLDMQVQRRRWQADAATERGGDYGSFQRSTFDCVRKAPEQEGRPAQRMAVYKDVTGGRGPRGKLFR